MQRLLFITVAAAFIFSGPAYADDDGCASSIFCGSIEDNGYCDNLAHCYPEKLWSHDAASGKCLPFSYYGHGGNYNRFYSKEQCEKTCIGYSKSYKNKNLCEKCPNPIHKAVNMDPHSLIQELEEGVFCNGDDCNCPRGKKCCPVVYSVTYYIQGTSYVKDFLGYTCVAAVMGECEEPYEDCSRRKRRHRHSHRKY